LNIGFHYGTLGEQRLAGFPASGVLS